MKAREKAISMPAFNKEDIRSLMKCTHRTAKMYFEFADEIDNAELGKYRIEPKKIRPETFERVTGRSLDAIRKEIEFELLTKQLKSGLPTKDTAYVA